MELLLSLVSFALRVVLPEEVRCVVRDLGDHVATECLDRRNHHPRDHFVEVVLQSGGRNHETILEHTTGVPCVTPFVEPRRVILDAPADPLVVPAERSFGLRDLVVRMLPGCLVAERLLVDGAAVVWIEHNQMKVGPSVDKIASKNLLDGGSGDSDCPPCYILGQNERHDLTLLSLNPSLGSGLTSILCGEYIKNKGGCKDYGLMINKCMFGENER